MKLDDKDLRILSLLILDGRAKYTHIARTLSEELNQSIPDTTVLFRIRKLQQAGIIKRFTASVTPEVLGYSICGIIWARIGGHILHEISVEHAHKIETELRGRPNVVFLTLDNNDTGIFAFVLGHEIQDIEEIYIKLKDNPDVVDAQMWLLKEPTKGDIGVMDVSSLLERGKIPDG
ncbi:MAG: Lrp/AsnC family transcriptional regulator [Promethearchaeota archaeon]